MKKNLLIIVSLFICSISYSQKTIKLYGLKLKASEITGLKNFGIGKGGFTEILKDNGSIIVKNIDDYTEVIGGYTDNVESKVPRPLFNISTFKGKYETLDKIDMDYYQTIGFDKLKKKKKEIAEEPLFKKFYAEFNSAQSSVAKKEVLLKDDYDKYRWHLLDTRLEISPQPTFAISKEQTTEYTAKLKADVKKDIKAQQLDAKVAAKVETYIEGLVNKAITVEAKFTDISYDANYIAFINDNITNLRKEDVKTEDMFIRNLNLYINSEFARLITEIGVLVFSADFDSKVIDEKSIAAELTDDLKIPSDQATAIAGTISASIKTKRTINFNSNFAAAFIISIRTDVSLDKLDYKKLHNSAVLLAK